MIRRVKMKASLEQSDEELWRLIVAGETDAFNALYRRRQAGIYRFALQMCGSETIAEDVTQEVFITLIRESQIFDPARGTLAGYLYFLRSGGGDNAMTVTTAPPKSPIMGGALSGKATKKVQPVYPPVAKAAGAQGPVAVGIVINEAGEVESAKAISGHPLLQAAAVDAAKEWRFSPTRLSGNPVKVSGRISFVFALPNTKG